MIQSNYTSDVFRAVKVAIKAHWGQTRADRKTPYVLHPIRVSEMIEDLAEEMFPLGVLKRDMVIAAILHDVLEDSGKGKGSVAITREAIAGEFGEKVAAIVSELTQDRNLPKDERRAKMIQHCGDMSLEARIIKLADRLNNMQDMKHMPQDFVDRYCAEAKEMVARMKGACSPFEAEIQNIMASYGKA